MLLAAAVDRLGVLIWQQTENGHKGIDPPVSVLEALTGAHSENDRGVESYSTAEAWEEARKEYI